MARPRTAQRLRWALLLVGVAAVVLVVYTGRQAITAKTNLELVAADFSTLSDQLTTGDQAGASHTLDLAQRHSRTARDSTSGPGWWLTSMIPGVGPNVIAVRTVADVTDQLSADVLPEVVRATAALTPAKLRPADGRIDLAPISAVAPGLVRADRRLSLQTDRVTRIDADGLAPQIARPVRMMQTRLGYATELSERASRAVRLLPSMLGAHGTRNYLMLFQNNAEARSTGGIPGSFAMIVARHGRVSIGRQGDAATIGRFERPPVALTAQERSLFGAQLGVFPQDVTLTPDFPRAAQLVSAMWRARHAGRVDGVLSTDPVALSALLRGTGPVRLAGGRMLTADNAVQSLLSTVYADIAEPAQQNVYFDGVAKQVFQAVASGQGRPRAVLDGLVTSTDQRRILLWSGHPAEQALLAPTRLGGTLSPSAATTPQVGVFLNDGGGSKLDYYLDYGVDVTSRRCQGDRQFLTVRLHMHSAVPHDPGTLPDYVARNAVGIPRGTIRTTLYVYAPVGGYLQQATYDGKPRDLAELRHQGRALVSQTVDLVPGGRHTMTYQMVTGKGQTARTDLRVTPGVHSDGTGVVGKSTCTA